MFAGIYPFFYADIHFPVLLCHNAPIHSFRSKSLTAFIYNQLLIFKRSRGQCVAGYFLCHLTAD